MDTGIVLINGKLSETISAIDHGFVYGDGIFDTWRIFKGKSFYAKDHLERLFTSAKKVGIKLPFSQDELLNLVNENSKKINKENLFVRVIVTRGEGMEGLLKTPAPTVVIYISERNFEPLSKIKAISSPIPKFSKDSFGRSIKSLNYSLQAEMLYKAKEVGATDVIFLNEFNFVSEATTSNIFLVKAGKMITPTLSSGCLPGVTRKIILEHFDVKETEVTLEDLLEAEEVFLTGTANFVTSIETLNTSTYHNFSYAEIVFSKLQSLIV